MPHVSNSTKHQGISTQHQLSSGHLHSSSRSGDKEKNARTTQQQQCSLPTQSQDTSTSFEAARSSNNKMRLGIHEECGTSSSRLDNTATTTLASSGSCHAMKHSVASKQKDSYNLTGQCESSSSCTNGLVHEVNRICVIATGTNGPSEHVHKSCDKNSVLEISKSYVTDDINVQHSIMAVCADETAKPNIDNLRSLQSEVHDSQSEHLQTDERNIDQIKGSETGCVKYSIDSVELIIDDTKVNKHISVNGKLIADTSTNNIEEDNPSTNEAKADKDNTGDVKQSKDNNEDVKRNKDSTEDFKPNKDNTEYVRPSIDEAKPSTDNTAEVKPRTIEAKASTDNQEDVTPSTADVKPSINNTVDVKPSTDEAKTNTDEAKASTCNSEDVKSSTIETKPSTDNTEVSASTEEVKPNIDNTDVSASTEEAKLKTAAAENGKLVTDEAKPSIHSAKKGKLNTDNTENICPSTDDTVSEKPGTHDAGNDKPRIDDTTITKQSTDNREYVKPKTSNAEMAEESTSDTESSRKNTSNAEHAYMHDSEATKTSCKQASCLSCPVSSPGQQQNLDDEENGLLLHSTSSEFTDSDVFGIDIPDLKDDQKTKEVCIENIKDSKSPTRVSTSDMGNGPSTAGLSRSNTDVNKKEVSKSNTVDSSPQTRKHGHRKKKSNMKRTKSDSSADMSRKFVLPLKPGVITIYTTTSTSPKTGNLRHVRPTSMSDMPKVESPLNGSATTCPRYAASSGVSPTKSSTNISVSHSASETKKLLSTRQGGSSSKSTDNPSLTPTKHVSPVSTSTTASPATQVSTTTSVSPATRMSPLSTVSPTVSNICDIAGAESWNVKSRKAYGICMSLYDQNPVTGKISGEFT